VPLSLFRANVPAATETRFRENNVIVEQVWTANTYRNFNYLIACPESGEALAIDPLDHRKRLGIARARAGTSPRS
jgi:hypothetical protein